MGNLRSYYLEGRIEAGIDEAGRGCLAGPVVAAAVILPEEFGHPLLNDSKKLSEKDRLELETIIKDEAISFATGEVDNHGIDHMNILKASHRAMNRAVQLLSPEPDFLLIDGNMFTPETEIPFICIVKGDGKYNSIAAASILAKTYRDRMMRKLHDDFPAYNWAQNKGYPTPEHKRAILTHGITKFHRQSFRLLDNEKQLKIAF
ncbi:MAG: ribonuclease HII [Bacteroidetes bacterium]|nr:ribonuclease HII [Bacteroidota bacterium]